jgi:hypothetical protein
LELAPDVEAAHALCLSANGDLELKRLAERWVQAAPAADAVFEWVRASVGKRR